MSQKQELHIVLVSNDPQRVYPALTLVLASTALGVKAHLYCTMSGLDVVKKETANKITLQGMPPIDKYLKDAIDSGTYVCACAPSKEFLNKMGITEETVFPGVKLEDAVTFLNKALNAARNGGIVLFV
jgi:Predicted peroxiredoxins